MDIDTVQNGSAELIKRMIEAGFSPNTMKVQQLLCLAEETGEAVQAGRRYLGLARTSGDLEALKTELADVVIAACCTAEAFKIDLDGATYRRLLEVLARPVRNK